jgi:hypothetical protein
LCLHFQRVADSTQQCAKQALVAVTAASHVCSLVDLIHAQVYSFREGVNHANGFAFNIPQSLSQTIRTFILGVSTLYV